MTRTAVHAALRESGFAEVMREARRRLGQRYAPWLPLPHAGQGTGAELLRTLHGGSLAEWAAEYASSGVPDTDAARRQVTVFEDLFAVGDHPARTDHEEVYLGADGLEMVERLLARPAVAKALDIGSGSGLTTAALARFARAVDAFDISQEAARATRLTMSLNGVAGQAVAVSVADVRAAPALDGPYDFICANPPSVPVPDSTPYRAAGNGGPDGLAVIRDVVDVTAAQLAEAGSAIMRLEASGDDSGPFGLEALTAPLLDGRRRVRLVVASRFRMAIRNAVSARWSSQLTSEPAGDLMARFDRHTADLGATRFYTCWLLVEPAERPSFLTVNASPGTFAAGGQFAHSGALPGVVEFAVRAAAVLPGTADLDYTPYLAMIVERWAEVRDALARGAPVDEAVDELFADARQRDVVGSRALLELMDLASELTS